MSPAKKNKKRPRRGGSRTAPRPKGMYLQLEVEANNRPNDSAVISEFPDIVRIGHSIARAVREYLRSVPMLPHVPPYRLTMWPRWHGTAKPRRSAPETGSAKAGSEVSDLD